MQQEWGAGADSFIEDQRKALLHAIATWANPQILKLKEIFDSERGWEGWTQVDLSYYLNHGWGSDVEARREVMVYDNSIQRTDIVLNANGIQYVIELKCHIKGDSKDKWMKGPVDDIKKLFQIFKPDYKGLKFGIGITFSNFTMPDPWHSRALDNGGVIWYRTF